MYDLYGRLEQVQGVSRVLSRDVRQLEKLFGQPYPVEIDGGPAGVRRHYVRAAFALIEAVVEQHRVLLLELSEAHIVSLDQGIAKRLRKRQTLREKIQDVYGAAGSAFGQAIELDLKPLAEAKNVGDRLTHPKSYKECSVFLPDIDKVKKGEEWFRALNNRFVRAAKQHWEGHADWRVPQKYSKQYNTTVST